jgi:hypothetical protein
MLTNKEIFARGWNNLYGVVSGTNMRIQDGECVLTGSLIGKALWETFYNGRRFRGQLFGQSPSEFTENAGFIMTMAPAPMSGEPMMIVQTPEEVAIGKLDAIKKTWSWGGAYPAVCDDAVCLPYSLATGWRDWLEANRRGIADVLRCDLPAEELLHTICPFWTGGMDFPGVGTFCTDNNGLCCRRPDGGIRHVANVDDVISVFSDLEVAR